MRRQISLALGALGFTLLGQLAQAAEPIYYSPSRYSSSVVQVQGTDDLGSAPASAAVEAMTGSHGHHGGCDKGCGHGHRCVGGIGFYYMQPSWENNPAYVISRSAGSGPITSSSAQQKEFDWDHEVAPLVWLGFVSCDGWGARVRYWRFDEDTKETITNSDPTGATVISSAAPLGLGFSSPGPLMSGAAVTVVITGGNSLLFPPGTVTGFNPGPLLDLGFSLGSDQLTFESTLEMDVFDVEATQEFQAGNWSLLLAGGVRSAKLSQSYNAFRINSVNFPESEVNVPFNVTDSATLQSDHEFKGLGPTAAIEARRECGSTGLSIYGKARGAVLFGTGEQKASLVTAYRGSFFVFGTAPFEAVSSSYASSSRDDVIPVMELELGAEYACDWHFGQLLLQAGVVSQTWFGAGNAANNELITGGTVGVSDNHSNLGLFGLKASIGLQY
jgi:hypothetical protein